MAEYRAGNIKHAGVCLKLRVNDEGDWLTEVGDREIKQPTRQKLLAQASRILRLEKRAINIPFTKVELKNHGYVNLKHGVVTGIHSGTGKLLVAWEDGTNGQLSGYGFEVLQRLTPEEEKKLVYFAREANDSAKMLRDFISRKYVYKGTQGLVDQVNAELKKEEK